jgi:hypothetical protein
MSNFFDGVSRWYWNVVYNINKYRSLLLTVIFGFFAIVSLQYWQQMSQPITRGYSETTIGEIQVRMWTPDKLYIDEKYQDKIDFEVAYEKGDVESEDIDVTIKWKGVDKNLAYTKNPLVFKLNSPDLEKRSSKIYYRRSDSSSAIAEIVADITIGDETKTISRSVSVAKAPNEIFAALSSVIAAFLAVFSLVDQLRKLFGKKE